MISKKKKKLTKKKEEENLEGKKNRKGKERKNEVP
jgi:hypothetical protein